ncbi:MAG TPA: PAS domain-containing protein [Vicinamibacterales bacterium]|nr:PAS domain-containing protein [Vicinamibacterales bacterium]
MDTAAAQHFRLIFRQVPGAVWVTDRDLRFTHLQGRLPHAAGLEADRLIGSTVYDFLGTHDPAHPAVAHHLRALSGERGAFQQIYNGRTYDVLIEPLRDPQGAIAGCVGSAIDVTDRQAAFEQLARSELRLAEGQRVAHVGSFEWEVAPNRLTWSDELHRIYGIAPGQFEGSYEAFLARVYPEDAAVTERTVLDAFQRRGPFDYDHRIVRADGAIRVLHTRGDIVCDDAGRPVRIVGSCWDVTEWKEVNLKLQRSVSLLQATFEATADGLLVVDSDGLITSFNQRFVSLWQIPRELLAQRTDDALRAHILDQLEDPHGSLQAMRRLSGQPATDSFDILKTRNGRVFERYSTPQRLGEEIVGRVWSFRDVTARSKMEERLREGAAQLELAVHAAHVGLWDWDLRSNQVLYSAEWKHQLGYEDHDIGNSLSEWHDRVHPDDRDRLRNTVDAFIENPWPGYNLEYRMRHRDGSYRWILAQASLMHDESGIATRMIGSHVDITERKREEEATQVARRRSGALIEGQKHVLEMIARGAPLEDTLVALVRLVEAQSADTLGSVLLLDEDQLHIRHGAAPSLPQSFTRGIDGQAIGERAGSCGTAAFRRKPVMVENIATDPLWADYRQLAIAHGLRACWSTPILDAHGNLLGTFALYFRRPAQPSPADLRLIEMATHTAAIAITRKREEETLRASEDRLRQTNIELERRVAERTQELEAAMREAQGADRLKSSFLATMSHELRTPLNSIIGFTGVLLKGLAGPLNEEQQKQLGMARESANRLLALINDVLDISRIEAGQVEIVKAPFDIRAAIESVMRSVTPQSSKKGLALVAAVDSSVGVVVSDRRRVEQILLNLLNNGVKFTEQGEVRLECRKQGRFLETTVRDTGIGIRSEHMDRLFKPFQQVDTGLDRRHEGTGLGLSICANLVRLLGGDIRARSESGVGSAFTFTIPLQE